MKVVAISTESEVVERLALARAQGYITFVYDHADPLRELEINKFLRVRSDAEMLEKIRLIEADPLTAEEVRKL